jgi:hypothetical protein
MKFNLYASMDESFRTAAENPALGGAGVSEFDEVKRVFLETNPFLLALTGLVTVLLYLLDSMSETSFMILAGQGIGLLIEAWKITKAVDIRLVRAQGGTLPYKIEVKDKHVLSKEEEETKVYDKLAFKWVTWGMTPFLIGYTIYSLLYEEHRGW